MEPEWNRESFLFLILFNMSLVMLKRAFPDSVKTNNLIHVV